MRAPSGSSAEPSKSSAIALSFQVSMRINSPGVKNASKMSHKRNQVNGVTLNNFQSGTEHFRVIQIRISQHRLRMASKRTETSFLFPLVFKSGNRCDAVYLDIKRPRPSRNVNENPRGRDPR